MERFIIFIGLYLATGMAVALALYLTRPRMSEDMQRLEEALEFGTFYLPARKSSWFARTSAIAVGYSLAGAYTIGAWPVALYQRWQFIRSSRKWQAQIEEREKPFQVQPADLLVRMTVREIEQRETVQDPLNAVPNLPFGHLNPAWEKLKSGMGPDDEIWTYSAQWKDGWRDPETREGYAIVRAGEVKGFWVASIKC